MIPEPFILLPFRHGHAKQILLPRNDTGTTPIVQRTGEYSDVEVDVFRKFVKSTSTVLDAGALFGCHTLALAGLAARVIAFEPQPIPYGLLCTNVRISELAGGQSNIWMERALLGSSVGPEQIPRHSLEERIGWGETKPGLGIFTYRSIIDLRYTSFIQEMHDVGRAIDGPPTYDAGKMHISAQYYDFMKLDVEGSEADVLKGAERTIRAHPPVIYLEYNWDQENIRAILDQLGYLHMFVHHAAESRMPNYLGTEVSCNPGPLMLLALPESRRDEADDEWLSSLRFDPVL